MNKKTYKWAKADDGEKRSVEITWPSRKPRFSTWDHGVREVDVQLPGEATLIDVEENREGASEVPPRDGRVGYKSIETGKVFWEYDPDEETEF